MPRNGKRFQRKDGFGMIIDEASSSQVLTPPLTEDEKEQQQHASKSGLRSIPAIIISPTRGGAIGTASNWHQECCCAAETVHTNGIANDDNVDIPYDPDCCVKKSTCATYTPPRRNCVYGTNRIWSCCSPGNRFANAVAHAPCEETFRNSLSAPRHYISGENIFPCVSAERLRVERHQRMRTPHLLHNDFRGEDETDSHNCVNDPNVSKDVLLREYAEELKRNELWKAQTHAAAYRHQLSLQRNMRPRCHYSTPDAAREMQCRKSSPRISPRAKMNSSRISEGMFYRQQSRNAHSMRVLNTAMQAAFLPVFAVLGLTAPLALGLCSALFHTFQIWCVPSTLTIICLFLVDAVQLATSLLLCLIYFRPTMAASNYSDGNDIFPSQERLLHDFFSGAQLRSPEVVIARMDPLYEEPAALILLFHCVVMIASILQESALLCGLHSKVDVMQSCRTCNQPLSRQFQRRNKKESIFPETARSATYAFQLAEETAQKIPALSDMRQNTFRQQCRICDATSNRCNLCHHAVRLCTPENCHGTRRAISHRSHLSRHQGCCGCTCRRCHTAAAAKCTEFPMRSNSFPGAVAVALPTIVSANNSRQCQYGSCSSTMLRRDLPQRLGGRSCSSRFEGQLPNTVTPQRHANGAKIHNRYSANMTKRSCHDKETLSFHTGTAGTTPKEVLSFKQCQLNQCHHHQQQRHVAKPNGAGFPRLRHMRTTNARRAVLFRPPPTPLAGSRKVCLPTTRTRKQLRPQRPDNVASAEYNTSGNTSIDAAAQLPDVELEPISGRTWPRTAASRTCTNANTDAQGAAITWRDPRHTASPVSDFSGEHLLFEYSNAAHSEDAPRAHLSARTESQANQHPWICNDSKQEELIPEATFPLEHSDRKEGMVNNGTNQRVISLTSLRLPSVLRMPEIGENCVKEKNKSSRQQPRNDNSCGSSSPISDSGFFSPVNNVFTPIHRLLPKSVFVSQYSPLVHAPLRGDGALFSDKRLVKEMIVHAEIQPKFPQNTLENEINQEKGTTVNTMCRTPVRRPGTPLTAGELTSHQPRSTADKPLLLQKRTNQDSTGWRPGASIDRTIYRSDNFIADIITPGSQLVYDPTAPPDIFSGPDSASNILLDEQISTPVLCPMLRKLNSNAGSVCSVIVRRNPFVNYVPRSLRVPGFTDGAARRSRALINTFLENCIKSESLLTSFKGSSRNAGAHIASFPIRSGLPQKFHRQLSSCSVDARRSRRILNLDTWQCRSLQSQKLLPFPC